MEYIYTIHPSPIQTFTVGFGFSPNPAPKELAGLEALLHHRRLGISPDPEGYSEYFITKYNNTIF
jgi:hypothetical protein